MNENLENALKLAVFFKEASMHLQLFACAFMIDYCHLILYNVRYLLSEK
jgi:hypothetical protein